MGVYLRVEAQPITTAWIYHNPDLWLISLSSDGSNWLTIADKNLWASTVWNEWDLNTLANCGYFYQWGNNYWFDWTHLNSITKSSSPVDAAWYWPWNYYSSSTFRYSMYEWDSSDNKDLWGGDTDTNASKQWPCDAWYHIPTFYEWDSLMTICTAISVTTPAHYRTYLKLPWRVTGVDGLYIVWWDCTLAGTDLWRWFYWQSKYYYDDHTYFFSIWTNSISAYNNKYYTDALPIRPFKNEAVQPDTSRTKLY